MDPWYKITREDEISTPALVIYPDRIENNISRMIKIAGGSERLRPHVKTHKMSGVVKLKIKQGITRFKCATLAEAEMVAQCGGQDIMLAMQPVGPHIERFFRLQKAYPQSRLSTLVDTEIIVKQIASLAFSSDQEIDLWLDINNGMNRTGIVPGKDALRLYMNISKIPLIKLRGLHVYDGHIHESDLAERRIICERAYEPVNSLISSIQRSGLPVPEVVAGGTPTFPIHANRKHIETSPGTCVLWDSGYSGNFPDLSFLHAALVMTRVVSKPGGQLLCLDLGHKAIAAEMPHPRISFPDIPVTRFLSHNEEHMVIESPEAEQWRPGDVLYGIPWHICPTVPRYKFAYAVKNGIIEGEWQVDARDRMISI
jgi:D-serine deaminase-like pyridoxal phosphate-dependent protein